MDMDVVAGIDLGGTKTKFGLVNRDGKLLAYHMIPTDSSTDYSSFFLLLKEEINRLQQTLGTNHNLMGVSVCAPSGNQKSGTIDSASNLKWPSKIPIGEILGNTFQLPVMVANDANAAAMGEMMYGVAMGMRNFICITLGTGLGCGIVLDGKLIMGAGSHAGELGHVIVKENGRKCACGRNGCLETYASATGMIRTVLGSDRYRSGKTTLSRVTPGELDTKKVAVAAQKGDEFALEIFDYTGKILGYKLADVVALLNPELIVLSGGLMKSGNLLLDPVKKYLNNRLLSVFHGTVDVKRSEMNSQHKIILGTSAFMWSKMNGINSLTG